MGNLFEEEMMKNVGGASGSQRLAALGKLLFTLWFGVLFHALDLTPFEV